MTVLVLVISDVRTCRCWKGRF